MNKTFPIFDVVDNNFKFQICHSDFLHRSVVRGQGEGVGWTPLPLRPFLVKIFELSRIFDLKIYKKNCSFIPITKSWLRHCFYINLYISLPSARVRQRRREEAEEKYQFSKRFYYARYVSRFLLKNKNAETLIICHYFPITRSEQTTHRDLLENINQGVLLANRRESKQHDSDVSFESIRF